MFNTSSSRACKAADPTNCRYHTLIQRMNECSSFDEYVAIREQLEKKPAPNPKAGLQTKVTLDDKAYVTGTERINTENEYNHVWLKDTHGKPVAFLKVRKGVEKDNAGQAVGTGVWVCDIEVNPAFRGTNAALAAIRQVKKHYGVNHLWSGDDFSQTGFSMFEKLREHEMMTGETTLKLKPGIREERLRAGSTVEHTFVRDWATLTPEYPLR